MHPTLNKNSRGEASKLENAAKKIKIISDSRSELIGLVVDVVSWDWSDAIVKLPSGERRVVYDGEWEHIKE